MERQRDRVPVERKMLIRGKTLAENPAMVIAKIGPMGKGRWESGWSSPCMPCRIRNMMRCDFCGRKGIRTRRVTRTCGRGRTAFLIEGIPVLSCPHCGESYLTAETLLEIEQDTLALAPARDRPEGCRRQIPGSGITQERSLPRMP